jgi:hypothetical protein
MRFTVGNLLRRQFDSRSNFGKSAAISYRVLSYFGNCTNDASLQLGTTFANHRFRVAACCNLW